MKYSRPRPHYRIKAVVKGGADKALLREKVGGRID